MTTAPAVLSRREAAAYVRLGVRTFARQVAAGRLPPPLDLTCRRKLWSRAALDRAIDPASAAPVGDPIMEMIRASQGASSQRP